ncbi:hypothetical protein ACWC9T_12170 [Kitasatospora sp. NPDC001159]
MGPSGSAAAVVPGRRGRLRVSERVYARIADQVARELLAEVWAGRSAKGAPPRVSVAVPGSTVTVRVAVELPLPADLARLAARLREQIGAQMAGLTGTRVAEVVVVVEKLVIRGAL